MHAMRGTFSGASEGTLLISAAAVMGFVLVPALAVARAARGTTGPWRAALFATIGLAVIVAALDMLWIWAQVNFPADILIWSEGDFVNDILKLRIGYPLYTAQANNESFIYTPGSQILTWLISSVAGRPDSIVFYRAVQVGYTIASAAVASVCCRRLVELATGRPLENAMVWGALWLPAFFLVATNDLTNPFVQHLHNDSLAQLFSITAFWILVEYVASRDRRLLLCMALMPALGFLIKQSLAQWAGLYVLQLLVFESPRAPRKAIVMGIASIAAVAAAVLAGLLIWGEPFRYWTMTVLGAHPFSPLRSVQHALDAGAYLAAGIAGGFLLMHAGAMRSLAGPWIVWLIVFLIAAWTSGVAWMLNHLGPASLISSVWLLAGLARVWPLRAGSDETDTAVVAPDSGGRWIKPAAATLLAAVFMSQLDTVRLPVQPFSPDASRYVREVEREFAGAPANSILLDAGTWVYLKDRTIMKDRAPSFGDRGYGEVGDFSAAIERLDRRMYSKILVRNFDSPDFWYDHHFWRRSSGMRAALERNYRVERKIPAVDPTRGERPGRYLFREIAVLVPRTAGQAAEAAETTSLPRDAR